VYSFNRTLYDVNTNLREVKYFEVSHCSTPVLGNRQNTFDLHVRLHLPELRARGLQGA
jgi:hypothetical protein